MGKRVAKSGEIDNMLCQSGKVRKAFTLIELLVVVAIISLLIGILLPALNIAKQKASIIKGIVNQRNIATSLNIFANDNSDRYPHSIASLGANGTGYSEWNWTDPRILTGYDNCYYPRKLNGGHRSMSAYLKDYIADPKILQCPNAPANYKYIDELWQTGDKWNNPDRIDPLDPATGSYCFWWGYRGTLTEFGKVFNGPTRSSGRVGESRILISDYFGSNTWRNPGEYGSCEIFNKAGIITSNPLYADFYSGGDILEDPPKFKLNAAFTDGHVESFKSFDVITLEVSNSWDGRVPFNPIVKKGKFYLPFSALP